MIYLLLRERVTMPHAPCPLTSVFACPLGGDATSDVSVRINLENQALLRSGWRCPSNSTTSC